MRAADLGQSAALNARVVGLLAAFHLLMRLVSVQRLVRLLTPTTLAPMAGWSQVERVQRAVDRLYWRRGLRSYGPCLRRALTLYYFLRRLGYPVKVAIGARLDGGQLAAHAWLALDGQPILERTAVGSYSLLAEWDGSQAPASPASGHPVRTTR